MVVDYLYIVEITSGWLMTATANSINNEGVSSNINGSDKPCSSLTKKRLAKDEKTEDANRRRHCNETEEIRQEVENTSR